jgi:hypothetical protein
VVEGAVVTSIPLLAQVRSMAALTIAAATIAVTGGVVIGAIPGLRVSAGAVGRTPQRAGAACDGDAMASPSARRPGGRRDRRSLDAALVGAGLVMHAASLR